jgi:hypothetical protein
MAQATVEHPIAFTLPNIPIATDLKSALIAINALRLAVQLIAGNVGTIPRSSTDIQSSGT